MVYEPVLAHTRAEVVTPGSAYGTESIVRVKVVVEGVVHVWLITLIVSVITAPESNDPKL